MCVDDRGAGRQCQLKRSLSMMGGRLCGRRAHACTHACMYARTHTHTHACTLARARTLVARTRAWHAHTHARTHACMARTHALWQARLSMRSAMSLMSAQQTEADISKARQHIRLLAQQAFTPTDTHARTHAHTHADAYQVHSQGVELRAKADDIDDFANLIERQSQSVISTPRTRPACTRAHAPTHPRTHARTHARTQAQAHVRMCTHVADCRSMRRRSTSRFCWPTSRFINGP